MSAQTMQVVHIHKYGGLEELVVEEALRPEPQAGEVLVRVYAAGINPADWKINAGLFKNFAPLTFPHTPGFDLAGVVEEVGPGVTALQKGQAVYGQGSQGTYAEYATAPVEKLALKPETLSFDEAAAITVGATTAWQALFEHGHLQAGQRVLIQGAAGGVGLFAIQFARWKGAHVIGTTSTSNVDFVRSLGAETVIDYTTTAVESAVHDVDLVFDTVGGKVLESSLLAVKRGGILVGIAGVPGEERARERDVHLVSFSATTSHEHLQTFARLIDEGQVKVVVAKSFPLQEVQQAYALGQSGHGRGRIVLHIAD